MSDKTKTLYERLGGYEAIAAVANDLLPRLRADAQLGRFWAHRGEDGITREKQLLIDFLCASAGGPMYYRGRDMVRTHRGMRISEGDWSVFLGHAGATLGKFRVPEAEQRDVVAFVQSLKKEIVEQRPGRSSPARRAGPQTNSRQMIQARPERHPTLPLAGTGRSPCVASNQDVTVALARLGLSSGTSRNSNRHRYDV